MKLQTKMMNNEGTIKFNCIRRQSSLPISKESFQSLYKWRMKFFYAGLIGAYPDGVGYGNISIRKHPDAFYITGSGTGGKEMLEEKHISLVTGWSHEGNWVECTGAINASAESLSHAAIYEAIPESGSVIHIHHKGMWDKYINELPTTSPNALYGTPEMANEVKRVAMTLEQDAVIVMGGHEEGMISWGRSVQGAGEALWKYYLEYRNTAPEFIDT